MGNFCGRCGASRAETDRFCNKCGAELPREAAVAGAPATPRCPRCSEVLLPDAAFCGMCGLSLRTAQADRSNNVSESTKPVSEPTPETSGAIGLETYQPGAEAGDEPSQDELSAEQSKEDMLRTIGPATPAVQDALVAELSSESAETDESEADANAGSTPDQLLRTTGPSGPVVQDVLASETAPRKQD